MLSDLEVTVNNVVVGMEVNKSRGNPKQIGVHARLLMMGYADPDKFIRDLLQNMLISEVARVLGFSLSTISRYCDKMGIRQMRHHCKQTRYEPVKEELPPNRHKKSDFFVCINCCKQTHIDLRAHHRAFQHHCVKCMKNLRRLRV